MADKPRVLVGVPGFAGVQPECQENFFALAFRLGRDHPGFDFIIKIIIKKEQWRARNNLVHMALANACDYLLMLDDDMLVPHELFTKLLAHDKDVVGALYWQRGGAHHPVLMDTPERDDGSYDLKFLSPFDERILKKGLHPVDVIGGGCMLFKVDVFRKLQQPYFWWEAEEGTDIAICRRLREAGVSIWADTSIELGHLGDKQIVTSKSIPKYSQVMGRMREALAQDLMDYLGMGQQQLEGALIEAGTRANRQEAWHRQPRDTWEGVRAYYQDGGEWEVLNLAYWSLNRDNHYRLYAINELDRHAPRGATVIDYGPGVGLATVALATQGYQVVPMDIAGAASFEFLKWRVKKRGLDDLVTCIDLDTPYPQAPIGRPVDAALMISVIDHLWAPYETLTWLHAQLVPGATLICDWEYLAHEDEPQHLLRYDTHHFHYWMHDLGFDSLPDKPWLFLRS